MKELCAATSGTKRRVRNALDFMAELAPQVGDLGLPTPSYLELKSIKTASPKQYLKGCGVLCASNDFSQVTAQEIDNKLTEWIDQSFLLGNKPWSGEKALAALMLLLPRIRSR